MRLTAPEMVAICGGCFILCKVKAERSFCWFAVPRLIVTPKRIFSCIWLHKFEHRNSKITSMILSFARSCNLMCFNRFDCTRNYWRMTFIRARTWFTANDTPKWSFRFVRSLCLIGPFFMPVCLLLWRAAKKTKIQSPRNWTRFNEYNM